MNRKPKTYKEAYIELRRKYKELLNSTKQKKIAVFAKNDAHQLCVQYGYRCRYQLRQLHIAVVWKTADVAGNRNSHEYLRQHYFDIDFRGLLRSVGCT